MSIDGKPGMWVFGFWVWGIDDEDVDDCSFVVSIDSLFCELVCSLEVDYSEVCDISEKSNVVSDIPP